MSFGLFCFLLCTAVSGTSRTAATLPDSIPVWYCQIGQWNLTKDSATGSTCFSHDAARDGIRSGMAASNVKLNSTLKNILELDVSMIFSGTPTCAGIFAKNKFVTMQFLVEKNRTGNYLHIVRIRDKQEESLLTSPINPLSGDTVNLKIVTVENQLKITVNGGDYFLSLPLEFTSFSFIGIICPSGAIKVPYLHVEAANKSYTNALKNAQLLNLHMEKMFHSENKQSQK